ncbi:MAG: hypothetical protein RL324_2445 [Verrucomicrobiota bacterium]
MRVSAFTPGAVVLALVLTGCRTVSEDRAATPASPPAQEAPAERFTSYIRVEGVVNGGFIKLNGSQASMFPGYVTVEVDASGKAVRQYVVALSTNVLGGNLGEFVIEQGQDVPVRIYYERTGPVVTGTARVEGRK